jgi:hypothetical protein
LESDPRGVQVRIRGLDVRVTAHAAVTFAKERNLERAAVVDERVVWRDALTRAMETAQLDAIVRRKVPALKAVVEQLSRGDVRGAIHQFDTQGRVHEIADHDERLNAIPRELREAAECLVVSPDNQSRTELNQVIHRAMQATGDVHRREHHAQVLVPGQEVTSHSSQGQTADRVLVHVDTTRAAEQLVNRRLAYVAVSRGRYDAQIYTNDKTHLAETQPRGLARAALEPSHALESAAQASAPTQRVEHAHSFRLGR